MNVKQIAGIVILSAATSFATMWGLPTVQPSPTPTFIRMTTTTAVKIPPIMPTSKRLTNAPADFVPAANAAIPATVHIKTKATRVASNNLPRRSPFGDLFDMDLDDFFGRPLRAPFRKWLPVPAPSSAKMVIS